MMKRNWIIGVLLSLSIVALVVFGLLLPGLQATPQAPLSFGGLTVTTIPLQQRNRSDALSPDTLAQIKINIAQPLFKGRLSPFSNASMIRVKNEHLSDSRGMKYFLTAPAKSGGPAGKISAGSMTIDGDGRAKTYDYRLNLAQYPKSAGTITFHSTYYFLDNDFELPVSVVVRK
jgi:hypothetical protein